MLSKKVWIPICLVVILIGILWTRDATHEVPLSHFTAKERATYDSHGRNIRTATISRRSLKMPTGLQGGI